MGRISKMGDRYIRRLMVVGMTSRIKQIKSTPERFDPWFADILQRKPAKLAAIAMANKTAKIIWAVLSRIEPYRVRAVRNERREHGDSKTNEVMVDKSAAKSRHRGLEFRANRPDTRLYLTNCKLLQKCLALLEPSTQGKAVFCRRSYCSRRKSAHLLLRCSSYR